MGFWQAPLPLWEPPVLRGTFNGNCNRLALFFGQVISHIDRYAHLYQSQWAMVMVVTAVLEGEAVYWVADLHSQHTRELGNTGLFLKVLREQFKDATSAQRAEGDIVELQQWGRLVADYLRNFHWLAGKLRGWPEWLLVHHFKVGLDRMLCEACVYRGLPPRLGTCYLAATELDAKLWVC